LTGREGYLVRGTRLMRAVCSAPVYRCAPNGEEVSVRLAVGQEVLAKSLKRKFYGGNWLLVSVGEKNGYVASSALVSVRR
jgi:hypothetical protein